MFTPGIWELLVILIIVIILFGAKRLPEIGKGLGEGIRNFKKAMAKPRESKEEEEKKEIESGEKPAH